MRGSFLTFTETIFPGFRAFQKHTIGIDTPRRSMLIGSIRGTGDRTPGCRNFRPDRTIRMECSGNHPTHPGRWNPLGFHLPFILGPVFPSRRLPFLVVIA